MTRPVDHYIDRTRRVRRVIRLAHAAEAKGHVAVVVTRRDFAAYQRYLRPQVRFAKPTLQVLGLNTLMYHNVAVIEGR